jgi:tellurite methyltransferase
MAEPDRQTWDARYRSGASQSQEPSGFLVALDDLLPCRGRALDVAGGTGRNALWLARRGLDVTLADISGMALGRARDRAVAAGVPLRILPIDLEDEPLPPGPWDLILCVDFLWRPLLRTVPAELAPGGLLVVTHPTRSNLQRHARPGPQHLLEDGEAPGLVRDLEIVRYEEGWTEEGRCEARLVARRGNSGSGRGIGDVPRTRSDAG